MAGEFKFTFGPWNIHEGADPFGPMVRGSIEFGKKIKMYKELGFDGVQFHDAAAVPDMNDLSDAQIIEKAKALKNTLDGEGLIAEFVAPRLWKIQELLTAAIQATVLIAGNMQLTEAKRQLILPIT